MKDLKGSEFGLGKALRVKGQVEPLGTTDWRLEGGLLTGIMDMRTDLSRSACTSLESFSIPY